METKSKPRARHRGRLRRSVSVSLPTELHDRLLQIQDETGAPVSVTIQRILRPALEARAGDDAHDKPPVPRPVA